MIAALPFINSQPLWSGLVAFYKLSDLSDSSGNGNTLTNVDGVTFAAGKIGNAAVFDGSNYLTGPSGLGNNFEQITVSCWVKRSDDSILSRFISNETDGEFNWGLYSDAETNDSIFYLYTDTGSIDTSLELEMNVYILITGVYDGETWKVYKNGNIVESNAITGLVQESSSPLQIGGAYNSGALTGEIDAIGIWKRGLSPSNIAALYNLGAGREI